MVYLKIKNFIVNVKTLDQFPSIGEIEENGLTLKENALIKVREVYKKTGLPCIGDDTGLEVDALNGAPGVFSARYAGKNCTYLDNINKMLNDLKNIPHQYRKAQFRTVMAYKDSNMELTCEGIVKGYIMKEFFNKGLWYLIIVSVLVVGVSLLMLLIDLLVYGLYMVLMYPLHTLIISGILFTTGLIYFLYTEK